MVGSGKAPAATACSVMASACASKAPRPGSSASARSSASAMVSGTRCWATADEVHGKNNASVNKKTVTGTRPRKTNIGPTPAGKTERVYSAGLAISDTRRKVCAEPATHPVDRADLQSASDEEVTDRQVRRPQVP